MPGLPEMPSDTPATLMDSGFIPPEELIVLKDWPLGTGSFGKVYHGFVYHQEVAIKVLNHGVAKDWVLSTDNEVPEDPTKLASVLQRNTTLLTLDREVFIMQQLRHENVLNFMGFCLDPPCLVTEYCSKSSLYDVIGKLQERPKSKARFNWKRRIDLAYGAAKGMLYLHTRNPPVLHTDLKSPNLLVDKCWRCKVADFGTCKFVDPKRNKLSIKVNNPCWLAPEVMNGAEATKESDVYPMGIILWELLTLRRPFETETGTEANVAQIQGGVLLRDERPEIPTDLSSTGCPVAEEYVQLMKDCWDKDPKNRPSFSEVCERLIRMGYAIRGKPPVSIPGTPLHIHQNGKLQKLNRRDESAIPVPQPVARKTSSRGLPQISDEVPLGQTTIQLPVEMSNEGPSDMSMPSDPRPKPPRFQLSKQAIGTWLRDYALRWMACVRPPRAGQRPVSSYQTVPTGDVAVDDGRHTSPWFRKYAERWLARLRLSRRQKPPSNHRPQVPCNGVVQVVHDDLETPMSPFDLHRQKFMNDRGVSNISEEEGALATPDRSGTVGDGVSAVDDTTDSSSASETSCSPNIDDPGCGAAERDLHCPPMGYPGMQSPVPPPGYPGSSAAGSSGHEALSPSPSFPNFATHQDSARLRQLATVMSSAFRSKTMGARPVIRVVAHEPPSSDKWRRMRDYVLRGDVQEREEWKRVVKFAQENESVPEKTGWEQCIKLVFGNSKIRQHQQWGKVKEFMVGDRRLETGSEPLFEDLSSMSIPEV